MPFKRGHEGSNVAGNDNISINICRALARGNEENDRRGRRVEAKRKGQERLDAGDRDGASFHFAQGIDVSPSMVRPLLYDTG